MKVDAGVSWWLFAIRFAVNCCFIRETIISSENLKTFTVQTHFIFKKSIALSLPQ